MSSLIFPGTMQAILQAYVSNNANQFYLDLLTQQPLATAQLRSQLTRASGGTYAPLSVVFGQVQQASNGVGALLPISGAWPGLSTDGRPISHVALLVSSAPNAAFADTDKVLLCNEISTVSVSSADLPVSTNPQNLSLTTALKNPVTAGSSALVVSTGQSLTVGSAITVTTNLSVASSATSLSCSISASPGFTTLPNNSVLVFNNGAFAQVSGDTPVSATSIAIKPLGSGLSIPSGSVASIGAPIGSTLVPIINNPTLVPSGSSFQLVTPYVADGSILDIQPLNGGLLRIG